MKTQLLQALLSMAFVPLLQSTRSHHFCVESTCPSKRACIISVYQDQKIASVWSDDSLITYLPNPFIADYKGNWRFCAMPANYRIEVSK